jgi:hypothetical protein
VLFAPGLSTYFTEDRLSIVGTTRDELVKFFENYRWEGPLFEYREAPHTTVKKVYRLKLPETPVTAADVAAAGSGSR